MGATARGVSKNNGKTIGIAPNWISNFEEIYDECSEFIDVKTMDERKMNFEQF